MSISRIGATNAAAASITGPNGNPGDIIIYHTFRSTAATIPTANAATFSLGSSSGSTCAYRTAYEFCTTATAVSRTFTGATQCVAIRYRGVRGIGAINFAAIASSATMNYGALTLIQSAGNSWIVGLGAHRTATNENVAPTGMSTITSGSVGTGPMASAFDTNAGVASWSAQTVGVNATSGRVSNTIELLADSSTLNSYRIGASTALSLANKKATFSGSFVEATAFASLPRTGLKRYVKWTVTQVEADTPTFGFGNDTSATNKSQGDADDSNNSVGWVQNGQVLLNSVVIGTAETFTTGDVLWLVIDDGAKKIWCYKTKYNNDVSASPDSGIGGFSYSTINAGQLTPAATLFDGGEIVVYDGNPSSPPAGLTTYAGWDTDINANLAVTLDPLTISATAQAKITATLAITLDACTVSASATVTTPGSGIHASLAVTLDPATIVSSASAKASAALTATLGATTLVANAVTKASGSLSATLDPATISSAAQAKATAALNIVLDALTISATTKAATKGALNVTLDNVTASLSASARATANLGITLDALTLSAVAKVKTTANLAITLADATLSAATQTKISDFVGATLDNATLAANAVVRATASLGVTLDSVLLDAQVRTQSIVSIASLNAALDDAVMAGSAVAKASASLAIALADCTLIAAGNAVVSGSLAITLDDVTTLLAARFSETPRYIFEATGRSYDHAGHLVYSFKALPRVRSFTAKARSYIFRAKPRGD